MSNKIETLYVYVPNMGYDGYTIVNLYVKKPKILADIPFGYYKSFIVNLYHFDLYYV
jgi:hypothetical protein